MNTATAANPSKSRLGNRREAGSSVAAVQAQTQQPQQPQQQQKQQLRQHLHREECLKRGLRFLPEQVMRPIYERAGLL